LETLQRDPHLAAVGLLVPDDHPTEGRTSAIRSSIRVDGAFASPGPPAEPRGRNTQSILHELGYCADDITALVSSGAAHTFAKDA